MLGEGPSVRPGHWGDEQTNQHIRMTYDVTSRIGNQEINKSNDESTSHIRHYRNPKVSFLGFLCLGGVHFFVRALRYRLNKIYFGGILLCFTWGCRVVIERKAGKGWVYGQSNHYVYYFARLYAPVGAIHSQT